MSNLDIREKLIQERFKELMQDPNFAENHNLNKDGSTMDRVRNGYENAHKKRKSRNGRMAHTTTRSDSMQPTASSEPLAGIVRMACDTFIF